MGSVLEENPGAAPVWLDQKDEMQYRGDYPVFQKSLLRPNLRGVLVVRAVDYVRSGKIGKPLMAKVVNCQGRFPAMGIGHKTDEPVPESVYYDIWTGPVPEMPFNRNRYHAIVKWHWHYGADDIAHVGCAPFWTA